MKANDELTSEELRKLMSKECVLDISSSTIRRVRREKLGWKHENTRYCQFFREPNKVKRLAFCLNALARKDTFETLFLQTKQPSKSSNTPECRLEKMVPKPSEKDAQNIR